jgi:hypothetical protein
MEMDREDEEAQLEDDMLEGIISPKEWKEQTTALHANTFEFTLDDTTKDALIEAFEGYETKEAFTEAYNAGTVKPFTDFTAEITALRDEAPQRPEPETEDEEA